MKLRRPSPALVISVIALTVACAGTGYAATVITSSSQIKNGAVQSGDIKNGSVQNVDIKKSTITETRLSKGLLTKIGGGAPAAPGAGVAFEGLRKAGPENQPANVVVKVATLNVPPGAYVVSAKTVMSAIVPPQAPLDALVQNNGALGGRCKLDAAGVGDESLQNVVVNGRQTPATMHMQLTRTVGAASDFTLECSAAIAWRISETSIIANKVGTVTLTETAP